MRRPWTSDEDALVRALYPESPTADIARRLCRSIRSVYQRAYAFGLHKSAAYLASPAACRTNGRQGLGTRFQKWLTPWNKGTHYVAGGRSVLTRFQPGERRGIAAKNWRPVGTILTDSDGYQRIKVREARQGEAHGFGNVRVWPLLQRHVWAQAHGPIPDGHSICFRDGNKANCAIDNLECVSRVELMRRNTVHNYPKPLASAIQLLGALNRNIRRRERGQEQNHRPTGSPIRNTRSAARSRSADGHSARKGDRGCGAGDRGDRESRG